MTTWLRAIIVGFIVALSLSRVAIADPEECRNAINEYNSARSEIFYALRSYGGCVSNSDGHDNCSGEFSQLQSAHGDFESAVSEYESECN
jgi:hypothetical protein